MDRDPTAPAAAAERPSPSAPPPLAPSAQDNLELIADISGREDAGVDRLRAAIEAISSFFGTPRYFVFALLFIAAWIAVNLWARSHGWRHFDEPPFFWLQGLVSSNALLLTVSVLIRQDRQAQLAEHRAHLDLQINMLTERKVTKALELIAVLSERERPRTQELDELLAPADAAAIMGAIKRSDAPS